MGTWSSTILGSDDALDLLSSLEKLIGLGDEMDWDDDPARTKTLLESAPVADFTSFIETQQPRGIAAQVVAYMHMDVGAVLPPSLRKVAIDACNSEDVSGWRKPEERRSRLTEFASMIDGYDDKTPTRPATEGLWQKVFENMSSNTAEAGNRKETPLPVSRDKAVEAEGNTPSSLTVSYVLVVGGLVGLLLWFLSIPRSDPFLIPTGTLSPSGALDPIIESILLGLLVTGMFLAPEIGPVCLAALGLLSILGLHVLHFF